MEQLTLTPFGPQTVIVVVLLSMDFWNCRVSSARSYPEIAKQPLTCKLFSFPQNVSGRVLVGLRYWNQVGYAPFISRPPPHFICVLALVCYRSTKMERVIGCSKVAMCVLSGYDKTAPERPS